MVDLSQRIPCGTDNQNSNPLVLERAPQLQRLLEVLGVSFKDVGLFYQALTHRSVLADRRGVSLVVTHQAHKSYERLEFLGDSVLGLIVTQRLVARRENFAEGHLSKIRAKIVCEGMLAKAAQRVGLGEAMFLGKGAEEAKKLDSVLADGIEALIGAAYLDGGLEMASQLVERFLGEVLAGDLKQFLAGDYKTTLQELTQKHLKLTPSYQLVLATGPEHQKWFEVVVTVGDLELGRGQGTSKKRASQQAAQTSIDAVLAITEGRKHD